MQSTWAAVRGNVTTVRLWMDGTLTTSYSPVCFNCSLCIRPVFPFMCKVTDETKFPVMSPWTARSAGPVFSAEVTKRPAYF